MRLLGQSAKRLGVDVHHAARGLADPLTMRLRGRALCPRASVCPRLRGSLGLPGHGAPSAVSIEHRAARCKPEACP